MGGLKSQNMDGGWKMRKKERPCVGGCTPFVSDLEIVLDKVQLNIGNINHQ
jgi:hypothetical protein